MKRQTENFDREFSKKLRVSDFNIHDCYVSIDTIVIGMACKQFIDETYIRFNRISTFIDPKKLLQFNSLYKHCYEQIELVKLIYTIDSELIKNN
jgi:hypothetical protein